MFEDHSLLKTEMNLYLSMVKQHSSELFVKHRHFLSSCPIFDKYFALIYAVYGSKVDRKINGKTIKKTMQSLISKMTGVIKPFFARRFQSRL